MTITYPLAWPAYTGVQAVTIRENNVVGVSASPFSGVEQVQEHQGQWWLADLTLPALNREEADQWMGFLGRLRGRVGTVLIGDPSRAVPRGSAAVTPGTPQVDGAGQSGLTLAIKTGLGSVTGYLKANDRFSLGTGADRRLHKVVSDVDLVGGKATMDIWPRLRATPGNNDTVHVAGATGRFRLTVNQIEETRARGDRLWRLPALTFREAL